MSSTREPLCFTKLACQELLQTPSQSIWQERCKRKQAAQKFHSLLTIPRPSEDDDPQPVRMSTFPTQRSPWLKDLPGTEQFENTPESSIQDLFKSQMSYLL